MPGQGKHARSCWIKGDDPGIVAVTYAGGDADAAKVRVASSDRGL